MLLHFGKPAYTGRCENIRADFRGKLAIQTERRTILAAETSLSAYVVVYRHSRSNRCCRNIEPSNESRKTERTRVCEFLSLIPLG